MKKKEYNLEIFIAFLHEVVNFRKVFFHFEKLYISYTYIKFILKRRHFDRNRTCSVIEGQRKSKIQFDLMDNVEFNIL